MRDSTFPDPGTPADDARLALAEAARRDGNPLALHDLAQAAIRDGDLHPRFKFLQTLALAQMADTADAERLYETYGLAGQTDDEDVLALRGRLYKDRALAARGADRRALFEAASQAYLRAFEVRSGYFPLINAATTAWGAGQVETARALAARVLDHPELAAPDSFFAAASRVEALVLLRRIDEAHTAIGAALAADHVGLGERASAYRQLDWICAAALSAKDRRTLLGAMRPPPVITFTGHMFRENDPNEAALGVRIAAEIDRLGSSVAYGALACGADILVAETILDRGGELHVVLPFDVPDFEEASVLPGGEAWIARFRRCLAGAASLTVATRAEYVRDDGQFAYGALLAMGLAKLRARQIEAEAVQIAIWDGLPARGQSGAAVDVATWRGLDLQTRVIDPGSIDRALERPLHPIDPNATTRVVRAIIFSHYRGYAQLAEAAIPAFIDQVMGRIAEVLNRRGEVVHARNTWGDALYVVVEDPASAASIALEIVEALRDVALASGSSDEQEGIGIGLHYGPVYQEVDRVTGKEGFYGSDVTLTARIEPKTFPGEIFTTQAFAAILAVTEPARFSARYVGQTELAKGYGVLPIYRLERGILETPSGRTASQPHEGEPVSGRRPPS